MANRLKSDLQHYGIAVLAVAIALGLSIVLEPVLQSAILALFYLSVVVSALYGGGRAGLLAIVLSALLSRYFLLTPKYTFALSSESSVVWLLTFGLNLPFISYVSAALRHARHRANVHLHWFQTSEERFKLALSSSSLALFQQDHDLRYRWVHYQQEPITASIIGKTDRDIFPEAEAEQIIALKRQVLKSGKSAREEVQVTIRGEIHYFDLLIEPLYDDYKRCIGINCAALDITERKQTEQALHESDRRFRQLAESNLFGVAFGDSDGVFTYTNNAFLTLTGYTRDDLAFRKLRWQDITPPEYLQLDAAASAELEAKGMFSPFEKEYIRKDGSRVPILIGGALLQESSDRPQQTVCFYIDLTERRRTELELRRVKERFELAASAIRGLVYEWNVKDNTVERTEGLMQVIGYSPDEAEPTIEWWNQWVHPDDLAHLQQTAHQALTNGNNEFTVEYRVRHRNGHYRHVWDRAKIERDASGNVVRTVGFNLDISDRKQAEAALRESEERFRTMAEAQHYLAEAISLLSSSLDYQTTLTSLAQLTVPQLADWCTVHICEEDGSVQPLAIAHVDPEKIVWAEAINRKYPFDSKQTQGVAQVLRTGQPELYPHISDELLVKSARDDEHLQILREVGFSSAMIVPLRAHGRILGAISFIFAESGRCYDQQNLMLAEELAQRAALAVDNARLYRAAQRDRAKAEAANRSKDEFLATLSHELRTPLNAMLGWMQMLNSHQLDEATTKRALDTVHRNTKALATIIKDLLDISSITTGKLRIDVCPTNLVPVIEAAIESVRPAAIAKSIDLNLAIADCDTTQFWIMGDPDRLQQVIWNLLSNAVKFTPNSGNVTVLLSLSNDVKPILVPAETSALNDSNAPAPTQYVQIQVIDTGIGITASFLPHVFDRFSQADMTITKAHGGLGLGLAIVRYLVEMQGGTVYVTSEGKGKGSTFTVKLPVLKRLGER